MSNPPLMTSPGSVRVMLSAEEVSRAKDGAQQLATDSMAKGSADAHGFQGDGLRIDELGALGELALCKWLGVPWAPKPGTYQRVPDIPQWGFDVRTSDQHSYKLLVRAGDHPERYHWLVTGKVPPKDDQPALMVIRGCMLGSDAQQPQWRHQGDPDRPPLYLVKQSALTYRPVLASPDGAGSRYRRWAHARFRDDRVSCDWCCYKVEGAPNFGIHETYKLPWCLWHNMPAHTLRRHRCEEIRFSEDGRKTAALGV